MLQQVQSCYNLLKF